MLAKHVALTCKHQCAAARVTGVHTCTALLSQCGFLHPNLLESAVPCRWHAPKPHPAKERFFPAGSTDVTRREGRSLADYYGVYTLIGLQR